MQLQHSYIVLPLPSILLTEATMDKWTAKKEASEAAKGVGLLIGGRHIAIDY